MSDLHNLGFEPLHHEEIGNSVKLRFNEDKDVVLGRDIEFVAGRKKLSFGMVVALTGDFLGDYTVGIGDVDQLSDTWSTWPTKGVMRSVPRLEKRLQDDQAGIVERVMDLMKRQRKEFDEKKAEPGRDAVQVYKEIADEYSREYVRATEEICDKIALCNWDHFGKGAIKAYSAFHTAALKKASLAYEASRPEVPEDKFKTAIAELQDTLDNYGTKLDNAETAHTAKIDQAEKAKDLDKAKDAHIGALRQATNGLLKAFDNVKDAYSKRDLTPPTPDNSETLKEMLKKAYFLEACAQHYLTDLFSAGHIRTPRRELHSVHYSGEIHRMDQCAGLMHDEDCKNGLEVKNRENKTWTMHDGKWLWGGDGSDENIQVAKAAAQASVDEIWRARQSGKIPPRFKVLDKIPDLDYDSPNNFTPLFRPEPGKNVILDVRGWTCPLTALDNDRWPTLYEFLKHDFQKKMYLFSSTKRSGAERSVNIMPSGIKTSIVPPNPDFTWQLRTTSTKLILNRYDKDLRSSSNLWPSDMWAEYIFPEGFEVIAAQPFPSHEDQCISVVGQLKELNKMVHLGLRYTDSYVTWNQPLRSEDVDPESYKIAHGKFTGDTSIATCCWNDVEKHGYVEISSASDMNSSPNVVAMDTLETPVDFMLSHSILTRETMEYNDYVCLYGYDWNSRCTTVTWLHSGAPKRKHILQNGVTLEFVQHGQPVLQPIFSSATGNLQTRLQLVPRPVQKPTRYHWEERSIDRAQAVFEMYHKTVPWLVRIYCGSSYRKGDKVRMDTIHLTIGHGERSELSISSNVFDLVEHGIGRWTETREVRWFTLDVKQAGVQDLVALVIDASEVEDGANLSLQLIVFPTSGIKLTFGTPTVSKIKIPLTGFKAPHMHFSDAHQVAWEEGTKDSGIMVLFSDHRSLGARYLLPKNGSYEYELRETLESTQ